MDEHWNERTPAASQQRGRRGGTCHTLQRLFPSFHSCSLANECSLHTRCSAAFRQAKFHPPPPPLDHLHLPLRFRPRHSGREHRRKTAAATTTTTTTTTTTHERTKASTNIHQRTNETNDPACLDLLVIGHSSAMTCHFEDLIGRPATHRVVESSSSSPLGIISVVGIPWF